MQQNIPFKVHPRAIKELGERLVTDDFVALSELVKNSYDAMATKVVIRFGEEANSHYIEIEDDGVGMSLNIIRDVWTVLFTPYKKVLAATENRKRKLSGEKGIGRLSAARLGTELEIYTREAGKPCFQLLLDWESLNDLDPDDTYSKYDFSSAGVIVTEAVESPFGVKGHGTIIRISKLKRSDWLTNDSLYDQLLSELSRIRPPLRSYEDFKIYVVNKGIVDEEVCVTKPPPEFLNKPHYFFNGSVDQFGVLASKLKVLKGSINESKNISKSLEKINPDAKKSNCGAFKFEFRVWDLDSESIKEVSELNELSRSEVREIIKLNRGVSLYRDDILVLPKTTGLDWLSLESRRVQRVGDKISSANIVAFVDLSSDENPNVKDTADREALERNEASDELKSFLYQIIQVLENERKRFKSKKEDKFTFRNLLETSEIEVSIRAVKDALDPDDNEEVLKQVSMLEEKIQERDKVLADRLGYYSRLASVGTIASYMVHEVRNSSTAITACNRDGRKVLESCESKDKSLIMRRLDISDKALRSLESISAAILPLSGAKFRRKSNEKISLKGVIEACIESNKKIISANEIDIQIKGIDIELAVSEGELFILFQNLVQNALYWIQKNKSKSNVLSIKAACSESSATITIEDSGLGIDPDFTEAIFYPGVSAKPDGTGMGLAVVAEICEKYRGSVSASNSVKLGGACFKLQLPME